MHIGSKRIRVSATDLYCCHSAAKRRNLQLVLLKDHNYWVYMMSSRTRVLYCGVTNSIRRRVFEHKTGKVEGFTSKYRCDRLVWLEHYGFVKNAIAREKKVKQMRRELKEALIREQNPAWADLSENWYTPDELAAEKATADSSGRLRRPAE